jgi:hypothetical protein
MSLIPPQPLEDVISRPLIGANADRLGELMEEGWRRWQEFHEEFAAQRQAIRDLDPGAARWEDLASFLVDRERAEMVTGYTVPDFHEENGELLTANVPVRALRLDGKVFACADTQGVPAADAHGQPIPVIGLNTPEVATRLRASVFPAQPTGAAWLRAPEGAETTFESLLPDGVSQPCGVSVFMRQTIRTSLGTPTEQAVELRLLLISENGTFLEITGDQRASLIRALLSAVRQREPMPEHAAAWADRIASAERSILPLLGRPTQPEHQNGVRHAIWPILAAVIS